VRAGGKDTPGKSQTIVIHDLKFEKYFANGVANLAKWQTTPKETKAEISERVPVQGHLPFDGIESGRAWPPPQRAINKRVEVIAIEPRIGKLFIQHFDQQEAKYG
jgi:hypothetical protein